MGKRHVYSQFLLPFEKMFVSLDQIVYAPEAEESKKKDIFNRHLEQPIENNCDQSGEQRDPARSEAGAL